LSASLRIATRKSPLALWQAEHVRGRLQALHPGLAVALLPLTTSGDRWLEQPLSAAGGKGLFVRELEDALLRGDADLAVHSMKDMPVQLPEGLCLGAFLPAEDPRDAFVSERHAALSELPEGARVGTSSLRRQAQLRALRPDVQVETLRGNVGTRLTRLEEGKFDAILLACAGLKRLGFESRIREALEPGRFLPAIGQGIVGIECRDSDAGTRALLAPLDDAHSRLRLAAERAMNVRLGGSCQVPVAGHAQVRDSARTIFLTGLVASPDGRNIIKDHVEGEAGRAAELGQELAERILTAGGRAILKSIGVNV
jgi:hydroxymethylbilane synthase